MNSTQKAVSGIYFIRTSVPGEHPAQREQEWVKIGRSVHIARRLRELQCEIESRLELMAIDPVDPPAGIPDRGLWTQLGRLERSYLAEFVPYRHGDSEWFEAAQPLIEEILHLQMAEGFPYDDFGISPFAPGYRRSLWFRTHFPVIDDSR